MKKNSIATVNHACTAIALFVFMQSALADKELYYSFSAIPDSLKTNAKAVIRNYEQTFEVKSAENGVLTVSYAITILNENGFNHAVFQIGYDKLSRISGIKGCVYDALGEKVEQLAMDKVIDHSAISGFSLYDDNRVKYFEPRTRSFPFTVTYSYTKEYNGLLTYPKWNPVIDYNVSLERSVFTVICPNSLSFRYKENNIAEKMTLAKEDIKSVYTWKLHNIIAIEAEPFSVSPDTYFPVVKITPDDFEIEGLKGNSSSWESFSKWVLKLLEDRDALVEETKQTIVQLVKDKTTDYEKAKAIYEYMQNKTRYVSIQQGLGGWQPFEAETIDRLGYGDCKALSNYMKSLLSVAGIRSYYTLISAGQSPGVFHHDFPGNQFNHAILCVPIDRDTLWLECTNQHVPFGYIGTFTDDRDALVITETGGKLVHTRTYTSSDNLQSRNSILRLDEAGNASLSTHTLYNGILYEKKSYFSRAGTEDRKNMILEEVNLPGASINKVEYRDIRREVPAIEEFLEIDVPRYAPFSGIRMLVSIVPFDRLRDIPKKITNRKSDVLIRRSVVTCDTLQIIIPDGYAKESVPCEIKIESKFGSYSLCSELKENKITGIRKFEIRKGQFPPSSYAELIDFYKKIAAADNSKISLKKIGS